MKNNNLLACLLVILSVTILASCASEGSRVVVSVGKPEVSASSRKENKRAIEPLAKLVIKENKVIQDSSNTGSKRSNKKIDVNRFNRLLRKKGEVHLAPVVDGIHDPENRATSMLQNPKEAFFEFPPARAGNQVDWVKAYDSGLIKPRNTLRGKDELPVIMDLNIVMEVKGSMPNVVFPHRPHTAVLDCANCHPAIFIPKSGANKITMTENLMGKKCGVCHGKVAFPLSVCSLCHSGKK